MGSDHGAPSKLPPQNLDAEKSVLGSLLLENIAVDPVAHGQGIGRRLMQRVEQHAIEMGLPVVRLYTNKAFATNLGFYRRLGYAIEREEPYKEGFTVYFAKAVGKP